MFSGLVGGKTDLVSLKAHHLLVGTGNPDLCKLRCNVYFKQSLPGLQNDLRIV